jgi:phosphatidate cytidylyltransferase
LPTPDELRLRALSAAVMAPIALAAAWYGGYVFAAMVAVAAAMMALEWDRMTGGSGRGSTTAVTMLTVAAALALALFGQAALALASVLAGAGAVALLAVRSGREPWMVGAGALYIGVPAIALLWLRVNPGDGREHVLWLLLVVWATDIGGYVSGRAIGGPRLAPRVSPGKTWAGLCGGVVAAAGVGAIVGFLLDQGRVGVTIFASATLAVVAQAGDLLESWLKRRCGIKDTGLVIPGHGGVMDRVDGLVAAAPIMALLALAAGGSLLR